MHEAYVHLSPLVRKLNVHSAYSGYRLIVFDGVFSL